MNIELKKKWVEALRSGKYEQGHIRLRDENDKYCCMGVLCDINDNTKWVKVDDVYSYIDSNILELKTQYQLIQLNDYQKKSFLEISDYIEGTEL